MEARALIAARRVLINGANGRKATSLVSPGDAIAVLEPPSRFVGRGGEKLDAALDHFGLDVAGKRALDAGSSTGGFVDCLLQHGAASVAAVDVGRGQLSQALRDDPRVQVHERVNLRFASVGAFGGASFDVLTADLSFISLTKVVVPLAGCLASPKADLVLLVKPQFECTRQEASIGKGVVSDPAVWLRSLTSVALAIVAAGGAIRGSTVSPLRGADGNTEFFLHAVAHEHTEAGITAGAGNTDAAARGLATIEPVLAAGVTEGLADVVAEACELSVSLPRRAVPRMGERGPVRVEKLR